MVWLKHSRSIPDAAICDWALRRTTPTPPASSGLERARIETSPSGARGRCSTHTAENSNGAPSRTPGGPGDERASRGLRGLPAMRVTGPAARVVSQRLAAGPTRRQQ